MRRTALIATCLALSACARTGTEPTAVEPAKEGAQAQAAAPAPTPEPATAPTLPQYDFYLLTRKGEPVKDPRIVSTQQAHPCGPIDLVRVSSIPMDDPVFMPSFVVEFDAGGMEIGKWGVPSEAEVTALDGQRLQFQVESGRYWVTTGGELQKLDDPARADDIRTSEGMFDCPKLPTFAESGAEQCFKVNDAAGKERRIAMEGVCS